MKTAKDYDFKHMPIEELARRIIAGVAGGIKRFGDTPELRDTLKGPLIETLAEARRQWSPCPEPSRN